MNNIEERLWDFIDGNCSEEEHLVITHLLETDETYRKTYEELLALNSEIKRVELDEPSMAFTYKVLQAVRAETVKVPLKAAINKNVIRALAGSVIFIISTLIIYAFFSINWSAANGDNISSYKLPRFAMPSLSPSADSFLIKGLAFFITVLLLLFTDAYVRKQRMAGKV